TSRASAFAKASDGVTVDARPSTSDPEGRSTVTWWTAPPTDAASSGATPHPAMRSFSAGSLLALLAAFVCVAPVGACGNSSAARDTGDAGGSGAETGPAGDDAQIGDIDSGLPAGDTHDPADCAEALATKSYVGCEYWPTVTANDVWSIFDYAV